MTVGVVCPACFERFDVVPPAAAEFPAEWDYEICCRPMIISFYADGAGDVEASARSLAD